MGERARRRDGSSAPQRLIAWRFPVWPAALTLWCIAVPARADTSYSALVLEHLRSSQDLVGLSLLVGLVMFSVVTAPVAFARNPQMDAAGRYLYRGAQQSAGKVRPRAGLSHRRAADHRRLGRRFRRGDRRRSQSRHGSAGRAAHFSASVPGCRPRLHSSSNPASKNSANVARPSISSPRVLPGAHSNSTGVRSAAALSCAFVMFRRPA